MSIYSALKTKTTLYILVLSLLASSSSSLFAYQLQPHTATYVAKIKKGVSVNGKAVRSLTKSENGNWIYRFEVTSFAADISESVQFKIENDKVLPSNYHYKLSPFLGRNKKRSVQFDWNNATASSNIEGKQWTLTKIPFNTYDRLSYQLQLLIDVDLKNLPIVYNIAHKGKLRPSKFDLLESVQIDTSLGQAKAHLVKKIRDNPSKRETHLWISETHPFLLLKMIQKEKNGEEYEINISSATLNGVPVSFTESASGVTP